MAAADKVVVSQGFVEAVVGGVADKVQVSQGFVDAVIGGVADKVFVSQGFVDVIIENIEEEVGGLLLNPDMRGGFPYHLHGGF